MDMSGKISLGLAKENGSVICQVCGLYFEPVDKEKVCSTCKKQKRRGYQATGIASTITRTDKAVGFFLGLVVVAVFLIGLGNIL